MAAFNLGQGGTVRRESILLIWIGGLVLAAALYAIGPDRFLDVCLAAIDAMDAAFRHLVFTLGAQVFGVVRALAIALYVVFAVLAILSSGRGLGGIGALVMLTLVDLVLLWRPFDPYPAPLSRWILALCLVLAGAIVMTQRLLGPPRMARGPYYPPPGRPQ
jgi:hypothetical protein